MRIARLEAANREAKNSLSLGSGPLLPEEGEVGDLRPTASHGSRKRDEKRDRRRDFLRGEPQKMVIREVIELPAKTGG